ncbi:AAA family ATPase [Spirosoma sp. 209]|uniref:AAA family ATPase n=1 Tax=Spirosoma sp. 209 TaxID=1955701 RepID=UPI00098D6BBF|nr:ATP-binding protein [Spirosoma sp. 209]
MKITGIEIGDYRQFKNIKFDFTYPEGHPKEGQPLEKVCFIGQSGTGKTTLLNIIWELVNTIYEAVQLPGYKALKQDSLPDNFIPDSLFSIKYFLNIGKTSIVFERDSQIEKTDKDFIDHFIKNEITKTDFYNLFDTDKLCLFIKDSIAREADAFLFDQKEQPLSFSDFVKTDTQIEKEKADYENRIQKAGYQKAVSLGDMESLSTWQYLLKDISQYDEVTVQEITKIVQNTPKKQLSEQLQKWIEANPRIELAEKCLNPILENFFIEVDTDGGNVPIALRTKRGTKINSSHLSTGTRQLLSTAIPLYKFNTKDSVILFDEPERSLFPDIQRGLIDYYTSLAPEAQFFFATHSPIIASAFEPCERFILHFDENGEVKCRNGVAPIGDDPNDILRKDFGMSPLVPDEGVDAYRKYLDLASRIKNEPDIQRRMELIAERAKLGNDYNFPVATLDEKN